MNTIFERRDSSRIDLKSIDNFFRQCDVSASSAKSDLDITILNISPKGMKVKLNSSEDISNLNIDDEIFIRGCIFNDRIGFLSNQKAVAVWKESSLVGVKFTPELEIDEVFIHEMME